MERTRVLEWRQDKKYLDYIDSEKCLLFERQEGEEKASLKNLRLKEVYIKDLDQIRALYCTGDFWTALRNMVRFCSRKRIYIQMMTIGILIL